MRADPGSAPSYIHRVGGERADIAPEDLSCNTESLGSDNISDSSVSILAQAWSSTAALLLCLELTVPPQAQL